MFNEVKTKLLTPKNVAGIELTFSSENSYTVNCLILERKNGQAVVTKAYTNLKSVKELEGKIPEFTPTALVLNGKGLIHKKASGISNTLSPEILPGINPADFIFQYFKLKDTYDIAIIRKKLAEDIVNELSKIKVYTTSLSLAFYNIQFIAEYINHSGDILTSQYKLKFVNKQISSYQILNPEEREAIIKPELNIGTEYIKSNSIIAYSAALKILVSGSVNSYDIQLNSILENQKKINQRLLLKTYSLAFLTTLLILLLGNFFVYSHYYNKNNDLISQYQFSLLQTERFDSLKKNVGSKKDFLGSAGWLNDSKMISYYADRIAATVPDSVTLVSLNIYPVTSKSSFGSRQWNFQQDTILITGECNDPSMLDQWIKEIQSIKNVKQSRINSYALKKKTETGFFTAEVLLK